MDEQETRQAVHDQIDQLEVPQDLVAAAIQTGIEQAASKQTKPRRRHLGRWILTAAAAVLLGVGGVAAVNPSVSQALSNVAWLTNFYVFQGGVNHFSTLHVDGTAKAMDQRVTSNGVTVHLVEAYYNGRKVGVAGEVTGLFDHEKADEAMAFDLSGTEPENLRPVTGGFQATKTGFRFRNVYEVKSAGLPNQIVLPINIDHINGIVGRWNFEITLDQTKKTHALAQNAYDLDIPGGEITPMTMTSFHEGAELVYRSTSTGGADVLGFNSIKNAAGQELIDSSDGFRVGLGVCYLPLKEPLVQGKAYQVICEIDQKTSKKPTLVTREVVLWPAD
ncbi:DUF4179 domain-containing protein [Lapidilactobacillus achengensis]|uniref:DUF4179 domain-containing protein n=1 Tax=Lapidilactobacillus achengensis TaxID=2486000 RepID=A0ABW1UP10_9LACO|nr:DUF4179 domain-containing protein [Lapidilactobacillus achengensis]